jgi:predicted transcriptional regulator
MFCDSRCDRRIAVQAKQQMLKAIEELPDNAGIGEALDRLYLLYKVERGLRQADRGEPLSQEEVRERMAKWLKQGGRPWRSHRPAKNAGLRYPSRGVQPAPHPPAGHSGLSALSVNSPSAGEGPARDGC